MSAMPVPLANYVALAAVIFFIGVAGVVAAAQSADHADVRSS